MSSSRYNMTFRSVAGHAACCNNYNHTHATIFFFHHICHATLGTLFRSGLA